MTKRPLYLLLISCLCTVLGWTQDTATLRGIITNLENQPLEDIAVYVDYNALLELTDKKGGFSFSLPSGRSYTLSISGLGIEGFQESIFLSRDTSLVFRIQWDAQDLTQVTIQAEDAFG
ncbi:MAG: carboxypeptidase-like regulatory domain-containing protein, partial [Bacteroidota bacterium]